MDLTGGRGPLPDASRLRDLERELGASLAEALDAPLGQLQPEATFSEMGVDSIIAVQWTRALAARYAVPVPTTTLFDHPTLRAFARFLLESLAPGRQPEGRAEESPRAPLPSSSDPRRDEGIAIIGISGQFPMARTVAELWSNLAGGRDCVSEVPPHRWPLDGFYDPEARGAGRSYCKWMGVLEDVDAFDPAFFSLSPAEAVWMDPQQRLFLQQCWKCIEDAGLDPLSLSGERCGVFAGCARVDYGESVPLGASGAQRLMGTSAAMLPARVAYFLDLVGPCLCVDTASSSSLVAIAQACDSLLLGRSDLALAGGAAVLSGPTLHVASSDAGMLSRQGRCFTFDARADGFVPAEAVGVVLLERLEDALQRGHHVHAVIRGWGVNQDGRTNGITAPSAASQARLQKDVYRRFGIDPASISLIEAHGTGTRLGDPVEVEALKQSFAAFTDRQGYCALGSAKSNLGHALAAAGVVGLIKVALALKHRLLPPTLHFERLNEHIVLDRSPFFVNTKLRAWEAEGDAPRRAAVNAFGYGGTNAHVVVEEYRPPSGRRATAQPAADGPALVVMSARGADRLKAQASQLLEAVRAGTLADADLFDVAYTLQVGRHAMKDRLAIVARSSDELAERLDGFIEGTGPTEGVYRGEVRRQEDVLDALNADEDTSILVDAWLRKGRYGKLLELWVKGLAVDWERLYGDRPPARVSLPTYPFATDRYWLPDLERSVDASRQEQAPAAQAAAAPAPPPPASVPAAAPPSRVSSPAAVDAGTLRDRVRDALVHSIAALLRMNAGDVELDAELNEFGFDSISLVAFSHALKDQCGVDVLPPVFFEHSTVRRLTTHLTETYPAELARALVAAPPGDPPAPTAAPADRVQPERRAPETDRAGARRSSPAEPEPIAIIGMSGRFPQAADPDELWENLVAGRDAIVETPPERWDWRSLHADAREANRTGTKWGAFIEGLADFDPLFFGISPREAEIMDPQQRLIMMYVWKAIEDAGYAPRGLAGTRTALFVGMSASGYDKLVADAGVPIDGSSAAAFLPSIGPNRTSYFLDLRGPSEPVETACSSALVALHRGVLALEADRCDLAIVGGVNAILNRARHVGLGKAGMLSPDGRCRTFSARADGYVRGEGVGMLLLKKLSAAERDGDHIYALVRGTAENHGGRSNSLTAPSPQAQAEVVKAACARAGIDPRSITYIEAHGTGTALGDPIEVNALKSAFKDLYELTPDSDLQGTRCGLGSVKTNIGHLEMAAGVASLIKVVLQLRNGVLVRSLHCQELNPYIQLEGSPFYVVRENQPWTPVRDAAGAELPRRAGVSSFGFGGVNAHVVVEEYRPRAAVTAAPVTSERPAMVVLSAASEEQLALQARQLLDLVTMARLSQSDLASLAFTLQVGREAMAYRLGLAAGSPAQLEDKLRRFLSGSPGEGIYTGDAKRDRAVLAHKGDADVQAVIDACLKSGQPATLLDLWAKGLTFDWGRLYGDPRPRRMRLPTYPFALTRCWVPARLHPLVHANVSDAAELRFSATFTAAEPMIAQHRINGRKVLPAAMHLEMARAAVVLAARARGGDATGRALQLRNVVWLRPIEARDEPLTLSVRLRAKDGGETAFELVSVSSVGEDVVHSRGSAAFTDGPGPEEARVDLATLLAAHGEQVFDGRACYDAFEARGLAYGPVYQAIETLRTDADRALGRLRLPATAPSTADGFVLHPTMLDGALQCAMGRLLARAERSAPAVLFSMQTVDVLRACPASAWVRVAAQSGGGRDAFDLDVIDDDGAVCVRLRGIATRPQAGEKPEPPRSTLAAGSPLAAGEPPPLAFVPVWEPETPATAEPWPDRDAALVLLGGSEEQRRAVQALYPRARLVPLSEDDSVEALVRRLGDAEDIDHLVLSLAARSTSGAAGVDAPAWGDDPESTAHGPVRRCFRVVKALLQLGYERRGLGLSVLTVEAQAIRLGAPIDPAQAAVHGLVGSLAKELKHWQVRLVDLERGRECPPAELLALPADPDGNAWVVRGGLYHRQRLVPAVLPEATPPAFTHGGVYVLVGGAGGVGVAFTEYLIRRYQAQVFWLGRRDEDAEIRDARERLGRIGPVPRYIACDATDAADIERAYRQIKAAAPRVHGLVHAAVVIDGCDVAHMDEERFLFALSAKTEVSRQLARVFAAEPLEALLVFSSIQSFEKTPRHSYYAAGCQFSDAFAQQLAAEWPCAVKVVNWGYWGGVGQAPPSASYLNWLEQAGMGTIDASEAFPALEALLAGPFAQLAFVRTTRPDAMQGARVAPERVWQAAAAPAAAHALAALRPAPPGPADLDDTDAERAQLIALLKRTLLGQLQSIGLLVEGGPTLADWKRRFGMSPLYDRWIEEAVRLLSQDGASAASGADAGATRPWREAWDEYRRTCTAPYPVARAALVDTMVTALPDILSGARPATDVMFPRASLALVEALYKTSRMSSYFNERTADTVAAYVEERRRQDPLARVRILEIGAGTGATSTVVFSKLQPHQAHVAEYCYTDISPVFLTHAEREFGPRAPYLRVQTFDVSTPLAPQGIEVGGYDLVVAANVLHATRRMRETLRNAKAVLKANGWLVLNELTDHSLVAHLTFGLLKGWWLYEDAALRVPGAPMLYPETWREVLEAEGFRRVTFPVASARSRGQQIIAAESDGLVRQAAGVAVPEPKAPRRSAPAAVTNQMLTEHVRGSLVEELGRALKIDTRKFDPDEALANYGVDSIVAVQTVDVLNERFGITLTTTSLFDHSSINRLTAHIVAQYGDRIGEQLRRPRGGSRSAAAEERPPAQAWPSAAPRGEARTAAPEEGSEDGRLPVREPLEAHPPLVPPSSPPARWSGPRSMARRRTAAGANDGDERSSAPQPIAVVGMSGRFAKAESVDELWEHLAAGTELTEEVSRWDLDDAGVAGAHLRGGFLKAIDQFDPLFFSISGLEATYMDPQQRIFLEEAWKALEDGGYAGAAIEGRRCGVYVGYNGSDYSSLIDGSVPAQALWGNVASVLSARIAYHLDLQGPAITIDSACSSSLVATHLACQALWAREIDFALAGGVYVQCTPRFYVSAMRAGMLSPRGRCHTFDARADGFVPGEGCGVVMLKRLDEALADGDHIHGVIRGSGINQDGATSGITAPSALSQERLEREVYERFNLRADQIQMVEAHGTGTQLGDPIEVRALTNAFRKDTDRRAFCALGSIKTNIGHTTAAAGVAGMIKILLSLRHAQVPPSLHYERANPHIDFEASPFYVNTELREWTAPPGLRRTAAVSSFGLSGTNAHMVIEEGPAPAAPSPPRPAYLIVASAQTERQLREQVERLLAHCEQRQPVDCGHVSRTLLTGRRHLAHRLAAVVRDPDELVAALRTWLDKGTALQVYAGELKPREHPHQESLARYGNQCLATARDTADADAYLEALSTVADLYLQGYPLDYAQLFRGSGCRRVPLPTYPFARDRYWVPGAGARPAQAPPSPAVLPTAPAPSILHPLVHANASDASGLHYTSSFTGDEFYLSDHVVRGARVLPGMAYLEMARAAAADARRLDGDSGALRLQHVAFARPLTADGRDVRVRIELSSEAGDALRFAVYAADRGAEALACCQGWVIACPVSTRPRIDLTAFEGCSARTWSGDECYARFEAGGFAYGPAHRGLTSVAAGDDDAGSPFVLARIALPDVVRATRGQYVLHPSLLDAGLQASIGFGLRHQGRPLFLPFAVEQVDVFAPTPDAAVACLRERPGAADGRVFDLDLCEPDGRVCVRLLGITARPMAPGVETGAPLLWAPHWRPRPVDATPRVEIEAGPSRVLFYAPEDAPQAELFRACAARLASASRDAECPALGPAAALAADMAGAVADHLLLAVQALLRSKASGGVRCQVVVPANGAGWLLSAAAALLKTAQLEDPKLRGQVIGLEADTPAERALEILRSEDRSGDDLVRYRGGQRLVRAFTRLAPAPTSMPWRPGGVYLITGGAGGLGRILAREIAARAEAPVLVLAGRTALDAARRDELHALEAAGARAEYRQTDVSSRSEVDVLIDGILARWGRLDGVLHCAGVLRDSFLTKKTLPELRAVLAPKLDGVVQLDQATQHCALDFFVTFSSASSVLGAVGQADYALANAFLDGHADRRAELVAAGQRQGRTLAINWPWWTAGGMQLAASSVASMTRRGLKALSTADGLAAFYQALTATDQAQVLVLAGQPERVEALLAERPQGTLLSAQPTAAARPAQDAPADGRVVRDYALHFLRKQFAATLQLPAERIEPKAALEQYGIDSVLVLQLTAVLEQTFGPLSKTLLFEYQTIDALAGYLLESHAERLRAALYPAQAPAAASPPALPASTLARPEPSAVTFVEAPRSHGPESARAGRAPASDAPGDDVAIIGIGGRYPRARNLREFWENLRTGQDCITEVPAERWDHALYFDEEKGKPGKTYAKWGGFLDGVDEFDPLFFNMSPRDAEVLDPQERLFLQCVYETLEDAGYTRESLSRSERPGRGRQVGVFVGVMYEEYQLFGVQDQLCGRPRAIVSSPASVANRVSYFFNLHGPSLAVDTMCSSSLMALHLAYQSLLRGECELAIAGGVNVSIHPNKYLLLAQGQFASSTGRCRSFGAGGDGYVPAEGVGSVLLRPLADALADGDRIHAVIKGSAVNHGGKTNGYTVPNPTAQAQVIARALEAARTDPRAISYVEAHGTGTALGDPIEIAALTRAFAERTPDRQFCAIGSAKSSVGHAEGAAGIAGLTKVVLQMQHGQLAPSLHAETPNPHIDFSVTPFVLQRTLAEWKRPQLERDGVTREYPRIAGISSFGAGGSNAHVIVAEHAVAEAHATAGAAGRPAIVVLSARSAEQLRAQAHNLLAAIAGGGLTDAELVRIAYTLQVGREAMEHRLALLAESLKQVRHKLERWLAGAQDVEDLYADEVKRHKEMLAVFAGDEDLLEAAAKWVERGRYAKLLELWVKGFAFDWTRLYGGGHPQPISLPTYPFLREKYWVKPTEAAVAVPGASASQAPRPSDGTPLGARTARVLRKGWEPAPLRARSRPPARALIAATAETQALAARLAARLPDSHVLLLDALDHPSRHRPLPWSRFDAWIDLVGCGETRHDAPAWMAWLQSWIEHGPNAGATALGVTRGLEDRHGQRVNLAGASRAGLYRMLRSEYRRLRSRHVDVEPEAQPAALVEQVVAELLHDGEDVEVSYLDGRRRRAVLEDAQQAAAWLSRPSTAVFPADLVLWITGGTRGIGAACARHFVRRHGARRLLLTGREALPPRDEWSVHRDRQDALGEKVRALLALEAEGVQVRTSSVALTDGPALRRELDEVRRSLGPIGGILHCAGTLDVDTPAFVHKSAEDIARVMAPKVAGLETLVACVEADPLRFVVLFSSVSAVVPALAVGWSDYAAANAYMDYFAAAYASRLPIISVQWGSWKEAGFGEARSPAYRRSGLASQTNEEALRFLDQAVADRIAPVVMPVIVEAADWQPQQLMQSADEPPAAAPVAPREAASKGPQPGPELTRAAEAWLRTLIAGQLKLDPERLDLDTPLQDYGVDSVLLVELLAPIGRAVGATLDPSILFEHSTVAAFARWLTRQHGDAIASALHAGSPSEPEEHAPQAPEPAPVSVRVLEPAPPAPQRSAGDIAVVGLSCRFPGAPNLGEYWRLLAEGRVAIRRVPEDRDPPPGTYYAGLLEDVTHFDPTYFGLSQDDARAMDPQALLLLEESLNAWHHAGYTPREIKGGRTGVYVGGRSRHRPDAACLEHASHPVIALGQNYLAANVSRFFDLRGPSVVVDTACSSALVALQIASQALLAGDISTALVGGVSLLDAGALRLFERRGILSPRPQFHVFDRRARGALLGEGAAMVVLKTVEQAHADGDSIYAVLKAVAINNDGRTASPTAPNLLAQRDVMAEALQKAALHPRDVGHLEVSGSGSEVTDLLELKAINAVYGAVDEGGCHLGSIKPNIGHPLLAEGIASFVKVVLMLHHGQRVPFLSAQEPMAHFDLGASRFRVCRSLEEWGGAPCAAINSFADGGTNAHVVLGPGEARMLPAARRPLPPTALRRVDLWPRSNGRAHETSNELVSPPGSGMGFWMQLTTAAR